MTDQKADDEISNEIVQTIYKKQKTKAVKSVSGFVLFIRNLSQSTTNDNLYDLLNEFGKITSLMLNLSKPSGDIAGYAIVSFANEEEAQNVILKLNKSKFEGNKIKVDWAFSKTVK